MQETEELSYQTLLNREEVKKEQKLSDLKHYSFEEYIKTKEERKALKEAKKDFKLYQMVNPTDNNKVILHTCGNNPPQIPYRGFTIGELLEELGMKTLN